MMVNGSQGETLAPKRSLALSGWLGATVMTGVTCLCAYLSFHIPPTPIPVTMQVFAVLVSGLVLGARWGMVAQAQYLALGALGAPVFAMGKAGFPALFGLTGGYLLAYPIAALVVGWLSEKISEQATDKSRLLRQMLICLLGLAIIYTYGCIWFWVLSRNTPFMSVVMGAGWFVLFDLVKATLAIGVARATR